MGIVVVSHCGLIFISLIPNDKNLFIGYFDVLFYKVFFKSFDPLLGFYLYIGRNSLYILDIITVLEIYVYLCIYMCVYRYTYMCTCMCIYVCMCVHIYRERKITQISSNLFSINLLCSYIQALTCCPKKSQNLAD